MFVIDPRVRNQIEPVVRRVLVVDPNMAAAKLLGDLMKGLGAREVVFEQDEKQAYEICRDLEPGMVLTERTGPRLDGEQLARRIRRSTLACRRAPIIMVTSDATATTIKGARDAGVHEFLRKPYTAGDLQRRVEVVALKPRNWVEALGYIGPDRRRFNSGEFKGEAKRQADKPVSQSEAQGEATDMALRILRSAHAKFDTDPMQALRAMREQALALKTIAVNTGEARIAVAVAGLEVALMNTQATQASLAGPVTKVLSLFPEPVAKVG
ncbi:MAG TPA: response regulator [Caulobacteraceae bacterium]